MPPPLDAPDTLRAALNRSRLALETALLDNAQGNYLGTFRLTPRAFFAASCGVPTLVESFEDLASYFAPGTEIATFASAGDVAAAAERLLADESARTAMADRARQRVLRDHTGDHRVVSFLQDVREWKARPGPLPPR